MNTALVLVGAAKVVFGAVVAVIGIFTASRALSLALRIRRVEAQLERGNVALGVVEGGAILSLALLCQHAVVSTFTAMDYLYRGATLDAGMFGSFALYAAVHVGASLLLGALAIAAGVLFYGALTRGVDEVAEITNGNVAPAIAIAAMMVAIALLVAPGLTTLLDGMVPMPTFVDLEHGG